MFNNGTSGFGNDVLLKPTTLEIISLRSLFTSGNALVDVNYLLKRKIQSGRPFWYKRKRGFYCSQ
jgi:hypothetical protein